MLFAEELVVLVSLAIEVMMQVKPFGNEVHCHAVLTTEGEEEVLRKPWVLVEMFDEIGDEVFTEECI